MALSASPLSTMKISRPKRIVKIVDRLRFVGDGFETGMHLLNQLRSPGDSIAQDKQTRCRSKESFGPLSRILKSSNVYGRLNTVLLFEPQKEGALRLFGQRMALGNYSAGG